MNRVLTLVFVHRLLPHDKHLFLALQPTVHSKGVVKNGLWLWRLVFFMAVTVTFSLIGFSAIIQTSQEI